jgi:hypothetical protein
MHACMHYDQDLGGLYICRERERERERERLGFWLWAEGRREKKLGYSLFVSGFTGGGFRY